MNPPKNFRDFAQNHWPHHVAKVDMLSRLSWVTTGAIITGAIAIIIRAV